jgi:hypothetical protein
VSRFRVAILHVGSLVALVALGSCSGRAQPGSREAAAAFTDPFAYCRAVGTLDAPDARYTGPAVPASVVAGLAKALGLGAETGFGPREEGVHWRCMDGTLLACTIGANLPCLTNADTNRTPTPAMIEHCASAPDAASIPAYVTGRATVYVWRCAGGEPEVVRATTQPDARGFRADIWHEIAP